MQTQSKVSEYARSNAFHGPKRQLLGNQAGHAPPAWRTSVTAAGRPPNKGKSPAESGSTIFLSKLPVDVGEKEVEELFNKTVGPLKESFLVYNSQGRSKGMAIVTFQRPGDALVARAKYNGRVVDGRRPIKIEIIVDDTPAALAARVPPAAPTLIDRLSMGPVPVQTPADAEPLSAKAIPTAPRQQPAYQNKPPPKAAPLPVKDIPIPPRRIKQKKGPKRLKKRGPVTVADLDQEMEDYRASAPENYALDASF